MSRKSPLLLLALLLALAPALQAQIVVRLNITRHLFICYEPVVATVTITNLSGRDLTLKSTDTVKWFSFDINNEQNLPVPPRVADYKLDPITIPIGQTVKRKLNLVNLYPITDYGAYHIKAVVYMADLDKYFSSNPVPIEISDGHPMWQQTVGIPAGQKNAGEYRQYELLSFQQPKSNMLYARIEDKDGGVVYGTFALGPLIDGYDPEQQIDALSELHVLEMVAPKEYVYTRLGPNAELLGQEDYIDLKTRPHLRRTENGDIIVTGGLHVEPQASPTGPAGPKLSDRPSTMPVQ